MIAVLLGGWSSEREVSLKSGSAVLKALKKLGMPCFAFDVTHQSLPLLWQQSFDKAFIVLHGRGGEDGYIQSELEKRNIPYTGSDVYASKLAMDKIATKARWQQQGIPTAPSIIYKNNQTQPDFALPWAVKPSFEGSSVGVHKVSDLTQLDAAVADVKNLDDTVMIEKWIDGQEYTAGILNNTVLPLIKMQTNRDFYDYSAKYESADTIYSCPCGLPTAQEEALKELCLRAFNSLGAKTWGRIDFMLDNTNQPFLLELNTIPGMTERSLVPMAAHESGISFEELVKQIACADV